MDVAQRIVFSSRMLDFEIVNEPLAAQRAPFKVDRWQLGIVDFEMCFVKRQKADCQVKRLKTGFSVEPAGKHGLAVTFFLHRKSCASRDARVFDR